MVGRRKRQLTSALADQALSSGSNVVFLLILARVSDTATFGQVSIVYSFFILVVGFSRACVTDPLLISTPAEVRTPGEHFAGILAAATMTGTLGGVLVLLAAPLFEEPLIPILMAAFMPVLAAQDAYRAVSFYERRVGRVLVHDGVWAVGQALLTVLFALTGSLSPEEAITAWGLGALLSTSLFAITTRCLPGRGGVRWIRLRRHRSLSLAIEFVSGQGSLQLSLLAVAAVLGPASIGALRIAMLAVSPLNLLAQGLYGWAMPRLAASAPRERSHFTAQLVLALGLLGVVMSASLVITPRDLMIAVIGEPWSVLPVSVLLVMLLERTVSVVGLPLGWLVRVKGGTYGLALNRSVSGVVLLLSSVVLAEVYGVMGAAVGFLLAGLLTTIWCFYLARGQTNDRPTMAVSDEERNA